MGAQTYVVGEEEITESKTTTKEEHLLGGHPSERSTQPRGKERRARGIGEEKNSGFGEVKKHL